MVDERREQMMKAEYTSKGDLLHLLLTVDLFKDNNVMIIDECVSFMIASTNATSLLTANTIYYLT